MVRKSKKVINLKHKCESDGYEVLLVLNIVNDKVCVEVESIASNTYNDVWNRKPFIERRKISAKSIRDMNNIVLVYKKY